MRPFYSNKIEALLDKDGNLPEHAWPGGYQIYYLVADGGVLCPKCSNSADCKHADQWDDQWRIVYYDINYENKELYCENCHSLIPPSYN